MGRGDRFIGKNEIVVIRATDVHDRCFDDQPLTFEGPALNKEIRERGTQVSGRGRWAGRGSIGDTVHGFFEALCRRRRALCRRYRGYGRGRANGRPHLPRGRWWCRIGVKTELLFSNRDHVGAREQALSLDASVIH